MTTANGVQGGLGGIGKEQGGELTGPAVIEAAKCAFARALIENMTGMFAEWPSDWTGKIRAQLAPTAGIPNLWEAANLIGACFNAVKVSNVTRTRCVEAITAIREFQGRLARESKVPTTVVFGTSGWREAIGEGFTLENVHKVARGIIAMMKSPEFLTTCGYGDFSQVRAAGVLVFRDNRYMGDAFKAAAMQELAAEGIRIHDAGECPTGVGSALLTELKAAGSINFTPSHNPMEYAGIKFNPADGGPADINLTSLIETHANALMRPEASGQPASTASSGTSSAGFSPASADYAPLRSPVDGAKRFTAFVAEKSKVFNLAALRAWLRERASELFIVVDNMHGSSRGYIQDLLGPETMSRLESAGSIRFFNTVDDYSFHGVKPEPNAKNQAALIVELKRSGRRLTLAVALDPDADRIRFGDADLDIDMNRFGAIAFANILRRGLPGGLATTVPSSGFASEIARVEGRNVYETAVGFKNFRAPLAGGQAVMAYEESDGISFTGHTLEKCALAGLLAALDAMSQSGRNLSDLYVGLRARYGYFYPGKGGADVKGVSVEAWQRYKDEVMKVLEGGLVKAGDALQVGPARKTVERVNIADGLKVVFADRSWILLRPSGTEPKFRYYYEVVGETELSDAETLLRYYGETAAALLDSARKKVAPVQ